MKDGKEDFFMVNPIIQSAVVGLNNASKRVEASAQNIAAAKSSTESLSDNDKDIVDLTVAAQDFKANLSSIKISERMQQNLLDILA
jgi:flagellar basal body rod protein FlgC